MYLINSFIFFFIGGLLALRRALRARPARTAVRDRSGLQRAVHDARHVHDLPVHHPDPGGLRELHRAAPYRRTGHGVPAHQRAVALDAADGWPAPAAELLHRQAPAGRLDELQPARPGPAARERSGPARTCGSSALVLVGTSSILGAVNFLVTIFKMRAPGMTLFRMPIMVWTVLVTSVLGAAGDAGPHERPDHAVHRPQLRRRVLRPAQRRRRDPLPERLLVLLAPGGLHHGPARDGHDQRDPAGLQPETAVRLQGVRLRDGGHRGTRLLRVGPPHVHDRVPSTCRSSA